MAEFQIAETGKALGRRIKRVIAYFTRSRVSKGRFIVPEG